MEIAVRIYSWYFNILSSSYSEFEIMDPNDSDVNSFMLLSQYSFPFSNITKFSIIS
jgi:hypothetical protein